jgi:hypothetical protein
MAKDILGLNKVLADTLQKHKEDVIETLHFIGLQCLEKMKLHQGATEDGVEYKAYTDQTGALRDSSGYVVVWKGQEVKMSAMNGQGASYARQVVSENPNVTGLILVAGMSYATFLLHGTKHIEGNYDVLVSASLHAEKLLKQYKLMD